MTTTFDAPAPDPATDLRPASGGCSCACSCGAAVDVPDQDSVVRASSPEFGGSGDAVGRFAPWRDSVFPSFPVSASPAELVALLGAVDPADVSDGDLVNGVAGWQQALCAVQAAQAMWLAELGARASVPDEWIADQVAAELAMTRRAAQDLVVRACLVGARPALRQAWAAGRVDARKVDVILKETAYLNEDAATVEPVVIADAVERAATLTGPQLVQHVRKQVLLADATAAERRRVRSVEDRCVSLTPSVDGVAWVSALLPAQDAVMVFTAVDALARTTRARGDRRTADQRRADAFTDVFVGILERQETPDGTPVPRRHGQAVSINVTVAASTLLGVDEDPGWLDSYGPITAPLARQLAQDGTWRRVLTDPATGLVCETGSVSYKPGIDVTRTVLARDVTCTFPGCRQPAVRCDLDHRAPFDPAKPAHGQTCVENLHALCRHHHRAKTAKRWTVTYERSTGITIWTSWLGFTYYRQPSRTLTDPTSLATLAARLHEQRPGQPPPGEPPQAQAPAHPPDQPPSGDPPRAQTPAHPPDQPPSGDPPRAQTPAHPPDQPPSGDPPRARTPAHPPDEPPSGIPQIGAPGVGEARPVESPRPSADGRADYPPPF